MLALGCVTATNRFDLCRRCDDFGSKTICRLAKLSSCHLCDCAAHHERRGKITQSQAWFCSPRGPLVIQNANDRYTRRWLQVLSRRNLVPEKWLAGVLAGQSRTRTETIVNRLAEEQRQLKAYESMGYDGDAVDSEETVRCLFAFCLPADVCGTPERKRMGHGRQSFARIATALGVGKMTSFAMLL